MSMARTRVIIAHVATFLAGIFLSTILSTYQLSRHNLTDPLLEIYGGNSASPVRKSEAIRGDSAKLNDEITNPVNSAVESANEGIKLKLSLDEERRKVIELKSQIEQLSGSNNFKPKDSFIDTPDTSESEYDNICSILPKPTPTALSLWSSHLDHIFKSTKHYSDKEYLYHDFTAFLLHFMTPDRLQRGVNTLPLDWTPVERSLDVILKRWKFINNKVRDYREKNKRAANESATSNALQDILNHPKIPRPLHVLVMGGSVTMGVVCHINPVTKSGITRRSCAWPGRMGSFFNEMFGGYEVVVFHSAALGGTNSESGITMWDYSLLPDDAPYPDIVISAYATNDMHYNSVQDALTKNITLEQSVFELNQKFIRLLLTPKRECGHPPPLVLYLDDYLGNEQNEVMTTMISSQVIHLLSVYYGIGSISYANVVRDMVYGHTKEWWFSSNWYEKGAYERAVHPNMGMHIANVWVVGFYMLNLVTTYCSFPLIGDLKNNQQEKMQHQIHNRLHSGLDRNSKDVWDYGYKSLNGMPNLKTTKQLNGGPRDKPRGIPPALTELLSLENITHLWSDEATSKSHLWRNEKECLENGRLANEDKDKDNPCIYSWVANLERFLDNPRRLTEKLKSVIISNEGWLAADDNNKLGWVPSGLGSKFTMEWKQVTRSVRTLNLMIMRSYGTKWEGSKLKVEIWSGDDHIASEEIIGSHEKGTSETYNVKMKIGKQDDEIALGSDLQIKFELVGGTAFKVTGMALCDH